MITITVIQVGVIGLLEIIIIMGKSTKNIEYGIQPMCLNFIAYQSIVLDQAINVSLENNRRSEKEWLMPSTHPTIMTTLMAKKFKSNALLFLIVFIVKISIYITSVDDVWLDLITRNYSVPTTRDKIYLIIFNAVFILFKSNILL